MLQEAKSLAIAEAPLDASGSTATASPQAEPNLHEQLTKLLGPVSPSLSAANAGPQLQHNPLAAKSPGHVPVQQLPLQQQGLLTAQDTYDLSVKALQLALNQPHYQAGFVVDGVGSKHLPSVAFAARCLLQALGLQNKALLPPDPAARSTSGAGANAAGKAAPAGAATKPSRPTGGSRPSSSKPGPRASLMPEPPPAVLDLSKPDVWEGPQQVRSCHIALTGTGGAAVL